MPAAWKRALITLIPKTETQSDNVDDWRPISLLLTSYKLFMSVIQKRLMGWIVDTNRLSCRQKGSLPRNGLQEHVYCLFTNIRDFMHQSTKLFVCFLDIKDAFGSLDHKFMLDSLSEAGYPDIYVELTKNIYDNSSFQVQTSNGLTSHIIRGKGIIQGCPWSVIAFEQGIDRWLRWVDYEYNHSHVHCPIQASVDDVCLMTNLEKNLKTMTKKSESFLTYTGMEVKHPKCAILHGRRSGNSWMKMSTTD